MMNALGADFTSLKSIAVWTLPPALYAAGSDRLIAVVRRRALARTGGGDRDGSRLAAVLAAVLSAVKGFALWLLRLLLAPWSTLVGFRRWVVDTAPVAPGRRAADSRGIGPDTQMVTFNGFGRWVVDPDTPPDSKPDTQAVTAAANGRTPRRPQRPASRPKVTGQRGAIKADRQAERARVLLAADPAMSGAELGRRLKVSARTGRRLKDQLTVNAEPTMDGGQDR
jgi:hypothetical protein